MLGGSCAHSHLQAVAGIDRRHLIGREFAHVASLSFLEFSVKVVRHKNWISFCGGLWKRNRRRITPGVRHVEAVVPTFRKPRKVGQPWSLHYKGGQLPHSRYGSQNWGTSRLFCTRIFGAIAIGRRKFSLTILDQGVVCQRI